MQVWERNRLVLLTRRQTEHTVRRVVVTRTTSGDSPWATPTKTSATPKPWHTGSAVVPKPAHHSAAARFTTRPQARSVHKSCSAVLPKWMLPCRPPERLSAHGPTLPPFV